MAVSPKVFSFVLTVGGCVGVPLILWKEGYWGTSGSQVSKNVPLATTPKTTATEQLKVKRQLPNVQNTSVQRGSCEIEDLKKDYEDFLLDQKRGEIYIEMSCENTNDGTGAGSLPHNWTGLFPEALFSNSESFSVGQKLNIRTDTKTEGSETRTTFKGGRLKSSFTGTWGDTLKKLKNQNPLLLWQSQKILINQT
ncbi:hypothetical protein DNK47_03100 [Mycoplasma wenyonii]|uniref:Lipoprotein n=1 Tax=Mycoplasma wenyonii TaxID=65123 RepID=A0A328PTK5_9MOLU|nr:hypothetical protein [Mycoplasma wenyonii]RAO94801.1 hypothetical protein DNK47_03100 [Mycoplasma wenyonii]